ncbi:hypothetical protein C2845_PM09G02390 [Panicum miliaceum]|uniref:Ubiquitin-like domain-containing protein n=1 Tax=Panicum miliaceum TaxID=4540 RepID=A0A3L6RXI8_PANMI|nr:hypothetical protein C2845_PM09G02390 [Panicum miliaceum]
MEVFCELIKLHGKVFLHNLPAYDERRSLYTEGPIPFGTENPAKKGQERSILIPFRATLLYYKIFFLHFYLMHRVVSYCVCSHVRFTMRKALKRLEKYSEDKFAQEFGTIVRSELTSGAAPVLPSPQLKSQNSGTEKSCLPSVGIYNSINKMIETGILTETSKCFSEIEPSLNFLSHGDKHGYFKVGSQDLSATFLDRCHHHVISDPVALQRTIEVNVRVAGLKIPMHTNLSITVGELVQNAVSKRNIRLKDEYVVLNGRNISKDCKLSSLPICDGSCISVTPRMRGGGEVTLQVVYHELDDVLNKNRQQMFYSVLLPQDYKQFDPHNPKQPTSALFWGTFSRYIIHHLLVCICRDGHERRKVCWDGAFDVADILIAPGHIRINPKVREVQYHPAGGQADYIRLHDIIWAHFRHPSNGAVPMLASHFFHQLRKCPDNLRTDGDFITFLINHPCLLSCSDREKIYSQVDQKIRQLGKRYMKKLRALLGSSTCLGWQAAVRSVAGFQPTYMYNARVDPVTNTKTSLYTHQLDQCFHF